jgi:LppP/LprE lipoprotein
MAAMRVTTTTRSTAGPLALLCAALLAGCGGGATKTVTVSSAPPATPEPTTAKTSTSATTKTSAPTTSTPAATAPAQPPATGGAVAPGAARKAPEPAFAEHEAGGQEAASAAGAVVREHGYTPNDTAEYHADQTLRVLIGTRTGSGDGYEQQAFFFVDGHYIGTDAREPSATVKVVSQSDTQVTLAYPLYRPGDSLSSPSGGQATVTFQLDNGQLTPLGQIPPTSSSTALSRR